MPRKKSSHFIPGKQYDMDPVVKRIGYSAYSKAMNQNMGMEPGGKRRKPKK